MVGDAGAFDGDDEEDDLDALLGAAPPLRTASRKPSALTQEVREAFAPCGVLSHAADQFRERDGQTEMAMAVARTMSLSEQAPRSCTAHSTTNCAAVSCESGMLC